MQPLYPFGLFKAGLSGVMVAVFAFFTTAGTYGLMRFGEFGRLIGNLWGPAAIFLDYLRRLGVRWPGLAILCLAWCRRGKDASLMTT